MVIFGLINIFLVNPLAVDSVYILDDDEIFFRSIILNLSICKKIYLKVINEFEIKNVMEFLI